MTETKLIGARSWVEDKWFKWPQAWIEFQYLQTYNGAAVARFKIKSRL